MGDRPPEISSPTPGAVYAEALFNDTVRLENHITLPDTGVLTSLAHDEVSLVEQMTAGILQENYLLLTSPHKIYVPSVFTVKARPRPYVNYEAAGKIYSRYRRCFIRDYSKNIADM